jgi:hypothetical protein
MLFNKCLQKAGEIIYMHFSLLLVFFILVINVFQNNLLSLGYLLFAMILIYNNRTFFRDMES